LFAVDWSRCQIKSCSFHFSRIEGEGVSNMSRGVAAGAALLAVAGIALIGLSPQPQVRGDWVQQRTEMLKAYEVRVQAPAGMGPPDAPRSGGSQVNLDDAGTNQINMVGFSPKGVGYMEFRSPSAAVAGTRAVGGQFLASGHGRFAQVTRLTGELEKERSQVHQLKGQVWALTSDVLPKMQEELHSLRLQLRSQAEGAKRGTGRAYSPTEGLREVGKLFSSMEHPRLPASKRAAAAARRVARGHAAAKQRH